jgi:hypothetical protein
MDQVTLINKDVNIVAYYFRNNARRLRCFPKRMEYNGKRVEFTETGTMHSAEQLYGKVQLFDMTDGQADYRLEFNPDTLSWKLVAVIDHHYEPSFTQLAAAF